jgi:hypothetical protein
MWQWYIHCPGRSSGTKAICRAVLDSRHGSVAFGEAVPGVERDADEILVLVLALDTSRAAASNASAIT